MQLKILNHFLNNYTMRNKKLLLLLFGLLSITTIAEAKNVPIESIIKNPKSYDGEAVEVVGIVTQYIATTSSSTAYYLLKGDYGGQIRVNIIGSKPEILKKYIIKGIVYYDVKSRTAFISEKSRIMVNPPVVESSEETTKPSVESKQETVTPPAESNSNFLLGIIAAGVLVLIILFFTLRNNNSKKSAVTPVVEQKSFDAPLSSYAKTTNQQNDDFKTIKINLNSIDSPKTLKFIPGELKIITGIDKGKSFKIAGYPTPAGSIVSIGREIIKGERSFAHIQLVEKTVSRKQAEIMQSNGKLTVKNLSQTNHTVVDGVELKPNEQIEIKPNSTIKVGEVEFQYIV